MNQKHTSTEPYLTLEDGEYQVTSDDGGIEVDRESALGLTTVRLRADYAAAPALLEALRFLLMMLDEGIGDAAHEDRWFARRCIAHAREAIALAAGENQNERTGGTT